MNWDRFDICTAYYLFFAENHSGQDSYGYKKLSQLSRMKYNPGLSVQNGDFENENQREIYSSLKRKARQGEIIP